MDKTYQPSIIEAKIYKEWESNGFFSPKIDERRQHFCIILPPPNANAPLHMGHAMYTVEDIMIRYHRMRGDSTLWLPGADHAGFETQYVFEKELAKQGKSRFDFPRKELYQMIWGFVQKNRGTMENQLRRLGFSLDWTRNTFTLDPDIVKIVYKIFKKLYEDGLVYRGERLVNYCTKCGTSFSDLEVNYVERKDPLYYIKYGPFTIATARPETKFRDTALAVNPKDRRYKNWLGKTLEIQGLLGPIKMTVVADPEVDPKFGTGIMKVTPAHDPHDFELGKKYNLPVTPIIDFNGRMDFSWFLEKKNSDPIYLERAKKYHGKKVAQARQLMVEDLKEDGLLVKVNENYSHRIGICYKCATVIEPLPLPQWFIKVEPLTKQAAAVVREEKIKIVPQRFKKIVLEWLENFKDWNISRQLVWGMQIPAWQCKDCHEWIVTDGEAPKYCTKCKNTNLVQDSDTFDTWFSSGQWPFATLMSGSSSKFKVQSSKLEDKTMSDFEYFYPTSVLETAYDILPWWVCRMIMLGLYETGNVPFKTVYFHGLVRDKHGQKMSKSKGNVVNPMEIIDKYGADALRMSLVFGTKAGSDQSISEDKIRGMRNFANKLWNIARFINLQFETVDLNAIPNYSAKLYQTLQTDDKAIIDELTQVIHNSSQGMKGYRFSNVAQSVYEFVWHRFADVYVEKTKDRLRTLTQRKDSSDGRPAQRGLLRGGRHDINTNEYQDAITALSIYRHVLMNILKLLHPFMPFVTEELWGKIPGNTEKPLIIASWPQ
ncbi:valine--tRNA ligase [Candidatus Woesebacteria bacterium]|nr:valine--tRNA ligase [Candidatus Woesebacteria bacterium]